MSRGAGLAEAGPAGLVLTEILGHPGEGPEVEARRATSLGRVRGCLKANAEDQMRWTAIVFHSPNFQRDEGNTVLESLFEMARAARGVAVKREVVGLLLFLVQQAQCTTSDGENETLIKTGVMSLCADCFEHVLRVEFDSVGLDTVLQLFQCLVRYPAFGRPFITPEGTRHLTYAMVHPSATPSHKQKACLALALLSKSTAASLSLTTEEAHPALLVELLGSDQPILNQTAAIVASLFLDTPVKVEAHRAGRLFVRRGVLESLCSCFLQWEEAAHIEPDQSVVYCLRCIATLMCHEEHVSHLPTALVRNVVVYLLRCDTLEGEFHDYMRFYVVHILNNVASSAQFQHILLEANLYNALVGCMDGRHRDVADMKLAAAQTIRTLTKHSRPHREALLTNHLLLAPLLMSLTGGLSDVAMQLLYVARNLAGDHLVTVDIIAGMALVSSVSNLVNRLAEHPDVPIGSRAVSAMRLCLEAVSCLAERETTRSEAVESLRLDLLIPYVTAVRDPLIHTHAHKIGDVCPGPRGVALVRAAVLAMSPDISLPRSDSVSSISSFKSLSSVGTLLPTEIFVHFNKPAPSP